MRLLIMNIYGKMGWEEKSDHTDRLLQTEVLSFACRIEVNECNREAKSAFYQWKNNHS